MTFQTRYNPDVSFPIACSNIFKLSAATESVPASYRVSYSVIGRNLGSTLPPEDTYYLYDNFGIPFSIFAIGSGTIDVYDILNTGECPVNGKTGIIVKSVWSGRAPILSSVSLQYLHQIAVFNINKWNLDILWSNDPNAKRIAFTAVEYPSIPDWTADIETMDGTTINPAEDYENNPKLKIWIIEGVKEIETPLAQERTIDVDGNIVSIVWGGMGENITGFIEISK